jgi:hypothetical protein
MNRDKELRTTHTVELFCHRAIWDYWNIVLPLGIYREVGYSVDELVDDALSFYVYLFTDLKDWGPREGYQFRRLSWALMTSTGDLQTLVSISGEELDEQLRDVRVCQLYIEHTTGVVREEDKDKPYGLDKFHNDDPALDPIPSHDRLGMRQNAFRGEIRPEVWKQHSEASLRARIRKRGGGSVTVSQGTWAGFVKLLDYYNLSDWEGVLIVLEQLREFMPILSEYSSSFREDLYLRQMACRAFALRLVEQANACLDNGSRIVGAARTISERLSLAKNRLEGGTSLTEFLSGTELSDVRRERAAQSQNAALSERDAAMLKSIL